MTDLSALIARVEEGTEANRGLDGQIFCAIAGLEYVMWDGAGCVYRDKSGIGHIDNARVKPWTASLDAVAVLVRQNLPGWAFSVSQGFGTETCFASVIPDIDGDLVEGSAQSPARALLAATLRAIQPKEGPGHDA